jgi:uncharacterized membrane protein
MQTQLSYIIGTLHCYMFRSLRNHLQAIHTKQFKTRQFVLFVSYILVGSHKCPWKREKLPVTL